MAFFLCYTLVMNREKLLISIGILIVILVSILFLNSKAVELENKMDKYGIKYEKSTFKVFNLIEYNNKINDYSTKKEKENKKLLQKCEEFKLECKIAGLDFFEANKKLNKIVSKEEVRLKSGKFVYLTIDDGPSKNTAPILDVLKN